MRRQKDNQGNSFSRGETAKGVGRSLLGDPNSLKRRGDKSAEVLGSEQRLPLILFFMRKV